jgi:hypothetical protein
MLAAVLTISFVPALSVTSPAGSLQPLFLSKPAADVFSLRGVVTLTPRACEGEGTSTTTAETVTQASVMWGSFRPIESASYREGRLIRTRTGAWPSSWRRNVVTRRLSHPQERRG